MHMQHYNVQVLIQTSADVSSWHMLQSQSVGQISVILGGEPIGSKSSCDDTGSVRGKDGVWKTGVDLNNSWNIRTYHR